MIKPGYLEFKRSFRGFGVLGCSALLALSSACVAGGGGASAGSSSGGDMGVALGVANAVNKMVRTTRGTYTKEVAGKLKKDGKGASRSFHSDEGFIPLPAQFIRSVSHGVLASQMDSQSDGANFIFFLRSGWNINEEQGLRDDFEENAWRDLESQQRQHVDGGGSFGGVPWKPYYRVVDEGDKRILRFAAADVAQAQGCVNCHNRWEADDGVQALRSRQGKTVGKTFKLNELMGAVFVSVQLDR